MRAARKAWEAIDITCTNKHWTAYTVKAKRHNLGNILEPSKIYPRAWRIIRKCLDCLICGSSQIKVEMFEDYYHSGAVVKINYSPVYLDYAREFWVVYCADLRTCKGRTATGRYERRGDAIHAWMCGNLAQQAFVYGYA